MFCSNAKKAIKEKNNQTNQPKKKTKKPAVSVEFAKTMKNQHRIIIFFNYQTKPCILCYNINYFQIKYFTFPTYFFYLLILILDDQHSHLCWIQTPST